MTNELEFEVADAKDDEPTDALFTRIVTADLKENVLNIWDAVLTGPATYHASLNRSKILHFFIPILNDGSNEVLVSVFDDLDGESLDLVAGEEHIMAAFDPSVMNMEVRYENA